MRFADARRLSWVLFLAAVVALGALLPVYWVYLFSTVAVGAIIARSVGLVTNQLGIITLCQMSFAAIGGWAVSWCALIWPSAPFPLLVLAGGAVAAPVGLLLGLATVRIRGVELAVVTLGFAAALDLVLRQGSFPGVGRGIPVLPAAPFDDSRWFFALCWAMLLVLQLGLALVGRTRHGLGWAAVKASERAAAALEVRVGLAKASALAIGALFAGIAGGLLAGQYGLLTTAVFTPLASMVHLATAVLCGAGLFAGAVLAGALTVFMPEVLRRAGLPLDVGNALLALGAFDALRRGNGGLMDQLNARIQDRAFRGARVGCELSPGIGSDSRLPAVEMPAVGAPGSGASETAVSEIAVSAETAAPAAARLEVRGLTVAFGAQRVLEEVDLAVERGEVHALIGPNGAGKTTLVDAVTGFLPGQAGELRLDGVRIEAASARERARLGLRRTFQQVPAVEALSVNEYLRLAAGRASTTGTARADRLAAVREFFGLPDGSVPIRLMDIGSRRILEIAAALAASPRVLLLDEPAAGLAEDESLALAERVRRIPTVLGAAVLLIEHDMDFVRAASSRTTVLDDGRIIGRGSTAAVLEDPRVVAAYLGEEVGR